MVINYPFRVTKRCSFLKSKIDEFYITEISEQKDNEIVFQRHIDILKILKKKRNYSRIIK